VVIGLVSAAAVDGNSGAQAQGQNFFIAASVIQSILNEHNVKPAMSLTSQRYNAAIDDFGRQHYKAALTGFQQAQNLYPGHPYAGHFVSESQAAISAGRDQTPDGLPTVYLILGSAGALVVVAAAATLIIIWRRRSRVLDRLAMPTDMPRHDVSPETDRSPMPAQPVGFATQSSYQQQPFAGPAQQPAGYWTPPSHVIAMDSQ
jgi:hypothetical protein